jgi:hypothetical protein
MIVTDIVSIIMNALANSAYRNFFNSKEMVIIACKRSSAAPSEKEGRFEYKDVLYLDTCQTEILRPHRREISYT